MGTISRNPLRSPDYSLYRVVTTDDDGTELTEKSSGINLIGYDKALVQVVPLSSVPDPIYDQSKFEAEFPSDGTDSAPAIEILFWNEALQRFIAHIPAITGKVDGEDNEGVPFEMTVDVHGRTMFVQVTGIEDGQAVAIFVAGFGHEESI